MGLYFLLKATFVLGNLPFEPKGITYRQTREAPHFLFQICSSASSSLQSQDVQSSGQKTCLLATGPPK